MIVHADESGSRPFDALADLCLTAQCFRRVSLVTLNICRTQAPTLTELLLASLHVDSFHPGLIVMHEQKTSGLTALSQQLDDILDTGSVPESQILRGLIEMQLLGIQHEGWKQESENFGD